MKFDEASNLLYSFKPRERRVIYTTRNGVAVSTIRTDKICPHDFAIGLVIPGRPEFYPTHIRLLFDLYLKSLSNSKDAHHLFCILEKINDGADPQNYLGKISKLSFPMYLDEPETNIFLAQLLMLEQEFNYGPRGCKQSNHMQPHLTRSDPLKNLAS